MKRLIIAVIAVLASVVLVNPAPVVADTSPHPLSGVTSVEDILVDQVHQRVFVSGDGGVDSWNLNPTYLAHFGSVAKQMTMSPDGTKLLVATAYGIELFNPASLAYLGTIADTGPCPDAMAVASGLVFFSYGDCYGQAPGLAALDLATGTVTKGLATGVTPTDVKLVSVPAQPNMLVASFGGSITVLDTVALPLPATTVRGTTGDLHAADISLTADGSAVYYASGGTAQDAVKTSDLTFVGLAGHSSPSPAVAVDVRGDGVFGVGRQAYSTPDVQFYTSAAENPFRQISTTAPWSPVRRGLAFGEKRAYVVTGDGQIGQYHYRLQSVFAAPATQVGITTDKSTYSYHGKAKITASLDVAAINRSVRIYVTPYKQAKKLIKTATVDAATGEYAFYYSNLDRNSVISLEYAGDDDHAPATATRSVKVRARVVLSSSSTSMSGSYHRLPASPAPAVTGTLTPAYTDACVEVVLQVLTSSGWRAADGTCVRATSGGKFSLRLYGFKKGEKARVTAIFPGNTSSYPNSAPSPRVTYYVVFT